jgi:hypothetical protein
MDATKGFVKKLPIYLIILLLTATGFLGGSAAGRGMLLGLFNSNASAVMLFFEPAMQYFVSFHMLNSSDEMKRLSGYYSLLDLDLIDSEFLGKRYEKEQNVAVKRTILWVLSYSDDHDEVFELFSALFPEEQDSLKREMLKSLKRMDEYFFLQFIEMHNIDTRFISDMK